MTAKKKPVKKKPKPNNKPRRDLADAEDISRVWDKPRRRFRRSDDSAVPTLRFTPYAWSKLLFLRDIGETEVGGFGISSDEDLFLIEDFRLIKQCSTFATVKFDDEAVADFFDEQVDQGRQPEHCGRCWIHTHPGESAEPSCIDEETFARVFGASNWALMFILACGGETYARLRFGCGPGAELLVPVEVAWDVPFAGTDQEAWAQEYDECVKAVVPKRLPKRQELNTEELTFLKENPELVDDWDFYTPAQNNDWERNIYDEREPL